MFNSGSVTAPTIVQFAGAFTGAESRDGRTEWAGWAFVDKESWCHLDGQAREEFLAGQNTIAVIARP
jgi:hypothetical protein